MSPDAPVSVHCSDRMGAPLGPRQRTLKPSFRGFIIFMALERTAGAPAAVSRFARLWPAYLVCAGPHEFAHRVLDFNPHHLTVGDALLNVLMMNKVIGNVPIDPILLDTDV